ncbi:molybdopterin guanine dinucleotide biosynthesis accessory protein MobB [Thermodesulfobium acidiphilum]|uniref:Molybdopterin guanine dinucleotide biosynthesis accessory protein MobB n=1 Tax=Thermodesulfobium acidiphilum TaxID=1794699 RepID=A0A2R4W2R6_THEAF|nr:molybdopterin-guanine dinucleotide biosynthesis protein B [Thermodesulfobium acidiphilum]AWB10962.1 molybdopterin guanine dinucleotide biosynthesis accessory protein MobB [Thermodesulfobium acidiphilum]
MLFEIISFVGKSNSGKTTFLEKLISEITKRGYKVGVLKHDVHGFEMDKEGKDTWRMAKAGAWSVGISHSEKMAIIQKVSKELTLEEVAKFFEGVDILFTEGYKKEGKKRIEIRRKGIEPLCKPNEIVALVTDEFTSEAVPQFPIDDPVPIADFIEEKFIKFRRVECALWVNGEEVELGSFVEKVIKEVNIALISTLHDIDPNIRSVDLKIRI